MKLVNNLIDFIYPRRCPVCHDVVTTKGALVCEECKDGFVKVKDPICLKCGKPLFNPEKLLCKMCEETDICFDEGRAVFVYDDAMRKSIYRFKYGQRKEYAKYYASEIANTYKDKIIRWNVDVIIPIPLHKSKLKKRGFNQAYLIAKELSYLTKIPVDNRILVRSKKTEKQKDLSAKDRGSNIKNAFKIRGNEVQYLSAMLIDDIYTTGATMRSATEVLKRYGVEQVYCMSLSIGRDV